LFGIYVNRASDERLADLALCDLWCANAAEIQTELAPGSSSARQTLAVLVETDVHPRDDRRTGTGEPQMMSAEWYDKDTRVEAAKRRNEFLFEKLRAVIAPTSRRCNVARRRIAARCVHDMVAARRLRSTRRRSRRISSPITRRLGCACAPSAPTPSRGLRASGCSRARLKRGCARNLRRARAGRVRPVCGMTIEEQPDRPGPPCGMALRSGVQLALPDVLDRRRRG
jgi:hypothetical protein